MIPKNIFNGAIDFLPNILIAARDIREEALPNSVGNWEFLFRMIFCLVILSSRVQPIRDAFLIKISIRGLIATFLDRKGRKRYTVKKKPEERER